MLDQSTKKKIDNARDILVGKVPDPKSQVEQITIALIYKFMDDMDKKSEEWGGKTTFFTGEYEKYAWSKIFDPRLGGFDLIALYADAIVKMNQNPNIPQLFRDIFKNAYLPYRDPETLKSFLKEINEFTYDHSEQLGDAFEYLLSVMDSQGDAGQFRTPRHIIDFIVEIVAPKKNETVLDPACGTAGFLISSYKHILKSNTKDRNGDQLTPDERKRLLNNFMGYDISPDMVRLSLVNLYLHGFSDPKIVEYDTLTSEEKWNETADVILANPPFMTPKGGIRPHKRFSIQAKRSEVLFVDYIAEHLNPHGRSGVIVPEGIIFQSQTAYKNLRKMLVENYLWAVVSMPAGVFNPYSMVKTSILLMDKMLAKNSDKILFVKIDSDGFNLGAQRRPIDKNDLPQTLDFIKNYRKALLDGKKIEEPSFANSVEKAKIKKSGDWSLSGDRYKVIARFGNTVIEWVELGRICDLEYGYTESAKDSGDARFIRITDINSNGKLIKTDKKFINISDNSKPYLLNKGDIVVARTGATYGKTLLFQEDYPAVFASFLIRLKFDAEKIINKYYWIFTLSEEYHKQKALLVQGGAQPQFNSNVIKKLLIPIPPLDVQKAIVAEIDGYLKIIDGAKQVVQNYKPAFKIDPNWEMVLFKSLTDIKTGKLNANKAVENGKYPFFTCSKKVFRIDNYAFDCEALLLSGNNATGVFDVKHYRGKFNAYQRTYIITINKNNVDKFKYPFLQYQLENHLELLKERSIGSSTRYLTKGMIENLQIALPPVHIQQDIIAQIEAEQEIVNANKKLIQMFEQKIKDKISEVWGE